MCDGARPGVLPALRPGGLMKADMASMSVLFTPQGLRATTLCWGSMAVAVVCGCCTQVLCCAAQAAIPWLTSTGGELAKAVIRILHIQHCWHLFLHIRCIHPPPLPACVHGLLLLLCTPSAGLLTTTCVWFTRVLSVTGRAWWTCR